MAANYGKTHEQKFKSNFHRDHLTLSEGPKAERIDGESKSRFTFSTHSFQDQ